MNDRFFDKMTQVNSEIIRYYLTAAGKDDSKKGLTLDSLAKHFYVTPAQLLRAYTAEIHGILFSPEWPGIENIPGIKTKRINDNIHVMDVWVAGTHWRMNTECSENEDESDSSECSENENASASSRSAPPSNGSWWRFLFWVFTVLLLTNPLVQEKLNPYFEYLHNATNQSLYHLYLIIVQGCQEFWWGQISSYLVFIG